jgi:queuine tRNA-ribosyltransferase
LGLWWQEILAIKTLKHQNITKNVTKNKFNIKFVRYLLKYVLVKFEIQHTENSCDARAGVLTTGHGKIQTPVFMPVGTLGSVKGIHHKELQEDIKAGIILGNTYHLFLRPGIEIISKAGGLHQFIGWDKAILTDSGGYQVFSLAENRKLTREGVCFNSHIDGAKIFFTPEQVVDIQRLLGSDIMMALDECTPYPCDYNYARDSMILTHEWLARGVAQYRQTKPAYQHQQSFFPIVQGSVYPDLRKQSAEVIAGYEMEGNAIGGLSVGEPADEMYKMIGEVTEILPKNKPRYLMGVGTPENILEAVALGVDMFDCVMPTRNGRNGMLFTKEGTINIKNLKWKDCFEPLDGVGTSFVDKAYTKAYVRHLIMSNEMLGAQIVSQHNLAFYLALLKEAREKIKQGQFAEWKNSICKSLSRRL